MKSLKKVITGAATGLIIGGTMAATPAAGAGMYHWHDGGWHWQAVAGTAAAPEEAAIAVLTRAL